jgi:hypothetical protein
MDSDGLLSNVDGVITGTVVCAAVIAAVGGTAESTGQIVIAIVGAVIVYWLAHIHAETIAFAVQHRRHPRDALRQAVRHTWTIPAASILPLVVLLVADLIGVSLRGAAWVALWAATALLAAYSYLAGSRAGLGVRGRVTCAASGAALGVLVAGLKALILH